MKIKLLLLGSLGGLCGIFISRFRKNTIDKHNLLPNMSPEEEISGKFISPVSSEDDNDYGCLQQIHSHDEFVENKTNLVLFIQAEDGDQLIKKIKESNKLRLEFFNDLYTYTIRLWVGDKINNFIKSGFEQMAHSGTIVKNDFVMLQFELNNSYNGFNKSDKDYSRTDFFYIICKNEIPLIKISERLAFEDALEMESWEK